MGYLGMGLFGMSQQAGSFVSVQVRVCLCVLPWVLSCDTGEGAAGPRCSLLLNFPSGRKFLQSSWVFSSENQVASLLLSVHVR